MESCAFLATTQHEECREEMMVVEARPWCMVHTPSLAYVQEVLQAAASRQLLLAHVKGDLLPGGSPR
jgi:hypothetical protein